MTLTPAAIRTDLKCGRGAISPGEKCRKGQATKAGPRNYRKEIKALEAEMEANSMNSWLQKTGKKRPKSGDDVAWDKLYQEWKQSPEAGRYGEAWNAIQKAKADRSKRNAGIAFGVGAGIGLGLAAAGVVSATRRRKGDGPGPRPEAGPKGPTPKPPASSGGITPVSVRVVGTGARSERPRLPSAGELAKLPGSMPKALLPPGPERLGKTRRMRANTEAAMRQAEQRIGQTAREEVRRIAQVGNTMAAAGEATGMAAKTTLRELRLRAEAARRRFEPGYRRGKSTRRREQPRLPEGGSAFQAPFRPKASKPPEYVEELGRLNTEKLRRWLSDADVSFLTPTYVDPARQDDGKKYTKTVINPETGRKNKVRYGAKGYKIAPGTSKGDRYCARSFGDMKSEGFDCSGSEKNTPLCLSRAKWKCSGKKSRRDNALTPRSLLL